MNFTIIIKPQIDGVVIMDLSYPSPEGEKRGVLKVKWVQGDDLKWGKFKDLEVLYGIISFFFNPFSFSLWHQ